MNNNFLDIVYDGIINDPNSFVIGAKDDKEIIGFAAFTLNSKKLYRRILIKNIFFFIKVIPKFIFQNKSKKIFDHLKYAGENKKIDPELLSICVVQGQQKRGVGSLLFDNVVDEASSRGVEIFKMVVGKNLHSNLFFSSKGCKLVKEFNFHQDQLSILYTKKC